MEKVLVIVCSVVCAMVLRIGRSPMLAIRLRFLGLLGLAIRLPFLWVV